MRMKSAHKEPEVMPKLFDGTAPKKSANLSINSDLLQQAKEHHINMSQALEKSLAELLREKKQQQWLLDNRKAVENYNRRIATRGVFSDGLRSF
jgi:antitoxin CcdA